jgi:hypothetical protein
MASGRIETLQRPTLGMVSHVLFMTTSTTLRLLADKGDSDKKVAWLSCRDFQHYQDLLAAAVRERSLGKEVVVLVPDI